MSHRTFRSLDEAPKLLGFTVRQWAMLILAAGALLGLVELTHMPGKAAITLGVFALGLPAALTYVSETGGIRIAGLLADALRWRLGAKTLAPAGRRPARAAGILIVPDRGRGRRA